MTRWADADDRWAGRVKAMARRIPMGSSVLDLGAGAQSLRRHLLADCTYTAADVKPRNGALAFDMDTNVYPVGTWDIAVMSGVLEYATDPDAVLSRVTTLAPILLLSYSHGGSLAYRRKQGWRNHLSRAGVELACERAGLKLSTVDKWHAHYIYLVRDAG